MFTSCIGGVCYWSLSSEGYHITVCLLDAFTGCVGGVYKRCFWTVFVGDIGRYGV